jgi:hypothetical protein
MIKEISEIVRLLKQRSRNIQQISTICAKIVENFLITIAPKNAIRNFWNLFISGIW